MRNAGKFHTVSLEEAELLYNRDPKHSVMIDVRDIDEYYVKHAAQAVNLPLDEFSEEALLKIIPDKNTKVFTYCRSGQRSRKAILQLADYGYKNLYDMGGLNGWPYKFGYGLD